MLVRILWELASAGLEGTRNSSSPLGRSSVDLTSWSELHLVWRGPDYRSTYPLEPASPSSSIGVHAGTGDWPLTRLRIGCEFVASSITWEFFCNSLGLEIFCTAFAELETYFVAFTRVQPTTTCFICVDLPYKT